MTSIHNLLFNSLDKILNKVDCLKFDRHFVIHEGSNFTRKSRKLSFKDMILFSLSIAGKPIREEQHDFFHYSNNTPTASALVQARSKISSRVFQFILYELNKAFMITIYIRAIILLWLMGLKCKYHLIIVILIHCIKIHLKVIFYLLFILMLL